MAETEETPHITTVRTQWRLRQQAARKPHFKIVDGEIVRYAVNPPADDLVTTVADAAAFRSSYGLIFNLFCLWESFNGGGRPRVSYGRGVC